MLEEERKFDVGAGFTLPDLAGCVPEAGRLIVRPALRLRAIYYDTVDLRLARSGASLRFRRGDDEPWTIKLPTDVAGVRNEISMAGPASAIPQRLLDLVTIYTRGAAVAPVITLNTTRHTHQICDSDDRVAIEVVDDAVSINDGRRVALRFREIEVERKTGRAKQLDRVEATLRAAGASVGGFTPKHVRALGLPATQPADWPDPPSLDPDGSFRADLPALAPAEGDSPEGGQPSPVQDVTAAAVLSTAIRRGVARLITHDPLVRLRTPIGEHDTAVHQMRVGCRRLRSDLRTFGSILDREWASGLREELRWLAGSLAGAREAEVLRARLRRTAEADPLIPLDEAAVVRIDADLAARLEDAMLVVEKAMCDHRYHRLLDALLEAATAPRLVSRGEEPAQTVLPTLAGKAWQLFASGANGVVGAGQLTATSPDGMWHAVRVNARRAWYAVDAVAGVLGGAASDLSNSLAAVQELLGEHQDAAVAADTWLAIANADPDDHALAVTAGRLYERERATVRATRDAFPAAWRATSKRRLREWMS